MKRIILIAVTLSLALLACEEEENIDFNLQEVTLDELLLSDPAVEMNPSGIAPLTAFIALEAKQEISVDMTVTGPEPLFKTWDFQAKEVDVPVYGLFPGRENKIALKITGKDGSYAYDTISIVTDTIPSYLPDVEIVKARKGLMEQGWNLCCTGLGNGDDFAPYPLMFDNNGVIRWYLNLAEKGMGWVSPFELLRNGNIVFGTANIIYEYNWMGMEVNRWTLPSQYWLHHDIIEKPDGNLLAAVNDFKLEETVDDIIVEVERGSGAILNIWDMRKILDVDRKDLTDFDEDWFHMNAIWYSEEDECLVVSGRQQGVVKVSKSNQLQWILAPHKGWGKAGINGDGFETSDYLLTAVDASGSPYNNNIQLGLEEPAGFSWPWGQHAPMYLENGNLFLLDNGFNRQFTGEEQYTHGVEYDIDEDALTVAQVWEYGKERGAEFFSPIISDVDVLPTTKNRLITSGISFAATNYSTIVEVNYPSKELVFEAKLYYRNELVDGGVFAWGGFDLTYRSERVQLSDAGAI